MSEAAQITEVFLHVSIAEAALLSARVALSQTPAAIAADDSGNGATLQAIDQLAEMHQALHAMGLWLQARGQALS